MMTLEPKRKLETWPEFIEGVKEGLKDSEAGRVNPLNVEQDHSEALAPLVDLQEQLDAALEHVRTLVKLLIRAEKWMDVEVTDAAGYQDYKEVVDAIAEESK